MPEVYKRKEGPGGPSFQRGEEDYTSPWSIMESATLRKPAMFAPFT